MANETLDYKIFSQIYANQLADDQYCCIVAEKCKNIVAVSNLRFEWQLHHAERVAEVMELIVHKDFRNQKFGKKLLEESIRIAKSKSCSQIEVCCNQKRKNAHKFYINEGLCKSHYKFYLRI